MILTEDLLVALIVTELPIPAFQGYFSRKWPLFGEDAGFATLALVMMILGVKVLGDLNTAATSQDALGLAFWRIVISAGILAMVMTVINVISVSFFLFCCNIDSCT